jgi:hypothetical protein
MTWSEKVILCCIRCILLHAAFLCCICKCSIFYMQYTYYLRGERAEEVHGVSADKKRRDSKYISIISNRVIRNSIFLYLYFYYLYIIYTLFTYYLYIIYILYNILLLHCRITCCRKTCRRAATRHVSTSRHVSSNSSSSRCRGSLHGSWDTRNMLAPPRACIKNTDECSAASACIQNTDLVMLCQLAKHPGITRVRPPPPPATPHTPLPASPLQTTQKNAKTICDKMRQSPCKLTGRYLFASV